MRSSDERILTTHVASLVPTSEIIEGMILRETGGSTDEDAFAKALESGVRDVFAKQAEMGIDVFDDGEYRKIGGFRTSLTA